MFITTAYYTAKPRRSEEKCTVFAVYHMAGGREIEKTIDKRKETCFNALKAVTKTVGTFRATEIRVS
jgi:hypothetical protein